MKRGSDFTTNPQSMNMHDLVKIMERQTILMLKRLTQTIQDPSKMKLGVIRFSPQKSIIHPSTSPNSRQN